MQRMTNTETIEGRIFQHDLELKTVQNAQSANYGKPFIQGNIEVATDEAGLNVVKTHYTYVSETTKNGGKNGTFANLKKIIEEGKTWIADGKENATLVQLSPSIALNDFYTSDNSGNEQLVSEKRNEGGFVNFATSINEDESKRTKFITDVVITGVKHIDADPEKNIDNDYAIVRGAIFNFRNDILPIEFVVRDAGGMKYFENLEATPSKPVFTQVWGNIVSLTKVVTYSQESAFGEDAVRTSKRTTKEYLITGARKSPYDFGDEKVLTAEDLTKAQQNREVYLADVKKRQDEYKAQKAANTPSPAVASTVTTGSFNF